MVIMRVWRYNIAYLIYRDMYYLLLQKCIMVLSKEDKEEGVQGAACL